MNSLETGNGGCLVLILKAILYVAIFGFIMWLLEKLVPGGVGTVLEIILVIVLIGLFIETCL